MAKSPVYSFRPDALFPLADAIGLRLTVRKPNSQNPDHYTLEVKGDEGLHRAGTRAGSAFSFTSKVEVIDSYLLPTESTTTAIRLRLAGNLQALFLMGHNKNNTVECYMLDGSKIDADARVLEKKWSRLRTLFAIRNAVVAHYILHKPTTKPVWVETPKAALYVRTYLMARQAHQMGTGDAEVLAEHVVHGRLPSADTFIPKWKIATAKRREEMLAEHAKEAAA